VRRFVLQSYCPDERFGVPVYVNWPNAKGVLMRILAWTILTSGTILATSPAPAQTYDPSYPVCLQVYGIEGGYIACGYTSMAQCAASASGRAAQCVINPYFAQFQSRPYKLPRKR
jgi:Protein of unknown function (DUF3551)